MSASTVQASILATDEAFAQAFGSDKGFINLAFQTALMRQADDDAVNFYLNQMADGASRGQVAMEIVNSSEAHLTFINQTYLQLLQRNSDADANAFFGNNLNNGASQISVVATVASSDEFQEMHGGVV
jgi:hypothetical protein